MIGQKELISYIDNIPVDNFSHFIIIVGSRGSGKTTLANYIANKLNATITHTGIKVDEIREIIDTAYTVRDTVVYHIQDGDTMRNEAKNALLKITEEPPKNAYFILTVQDDSTLLPTIKSRANVMYIQPYTKEELISYFWSLPYISSDVSKEEANEICSIATTPYEVEKLIEYGAEFIEYVELVLDNIADVEPANAFKSSGKLAIKSDAGYDLKLFWEVFCSICMKRLLDDCLKYSTGIITTIPYLLKLSKTGVNKQQLYDNWVFDIRREWQ